MLMYLIKSKFNIIENKLIRLIEQSNLKKIYF